MNLSNQRMRHIVAATMMLIVTCLTAAGSPFVQVVAADEAGTPPDWVTAPVVTQDEIDQIQIDSVRAATHDASEAADLVSDDFNECTLDEDVWTFTDPPNAGASYAVNGTQVSITVPEDENYDLWYPKDPPGPGGTVIDNNFAARLTQPIDNEDFTVIVKFDSEVELRYQKQGILIADGQGNLLNFEFYSKVVPDGGSGFVTEVYIFSAILTAGSGSFTVNKDKITATWPMYMKVSRSGRTYAQSYSSTGDDDDYMSPTNASFDMLTTFIPATVGIYSGSTSDSSAGPPGHTAVFDYFFDSESKIDPEDPKDYTLTTDTVGDGTVAVTPDMSTYACGDTLVFEATADPGWEFSEWSGDVTGSDSPTAAIPFEMGMEVTASFIAGDQFALTTNTVGMGTIAKDPDQTGYNLNDTVTVTAQPVEGWSFASWSGSINSTNISDTVTISGNEAVTATFVQDAIHALTVDITGSGTVSKDPDKPLYEDGEMVTLTASPTDGWSFDGWGGGASGTDTTTTVTMNGDITATATFTQEGYAVDVSVIGGGQVTKDPDKTSYLPGETVTLTALANDGYSFGNWGGDATGTDPTTSVTISSQTPANILVIATFSQDQYVLTLNTVGDGSIEVVPQKPTYVYGDIVTLTANPEPNATFQNWSGAVSGTTSPTQLEITGDMTVSATFKDSGTGTDVELFLPILEN